MFIMFNLTEICIIISYRNHTVQYPEADEHKNSQTNLEGSQQHELLPPTLENDVYIQCKSNLLCKLLLKPNCPSFRI